MTQDEIIRMAREAGLIQYVQVEKTCVSNALERFSALVAAHEREKQAKQEPVSQEPIGKATVNVNGTVEIELFATSINLDIGETLIYAAPVRTKDLTDDEINKALEIIDYFKTYSQIRIDAARAVIAADREKNK